MGLASTGRGKAPSRSTSLLSSTMQMKRRNFHRNDLLASEHSASALDLSCRVASSAPWTLRASSPAAFGSSSATPSDFSRSDVLARGRDEAAEPCFPGFQHLDELADRGSPFHARGACRPPMWGHRGFSRPPLLLRRCVMTFWVPQKRLYPLTRAQLIIYEGLFLLNALFLSCLLLRLLCFRCHIKLRSRVIPGTEIIHE